MIDGKSTNQKDFFIILLLLTFFEKTHKTSKAEWGFLLSNGIGLYRDI
jgi:hypothetical protein